MCSDSVSELILCKDSGIFSEEAKEQPSEERVQSVATRLVVEDSRISLK